MLSRPKFTNTYFGFDIQQKSESALTICQIIYNNNNISEEQHDTLSLLSNANFDQARFELTFHTSVYAIDPSGDINLRTVFCHH